MIWPVDAFIWLAKQLPWVLGLSVILAAFSWAHWISMMTGRPLRDIWKQPHYGAAFSFGLLGVATGIVLNPLYPWERYVGGVLALYFLIETGRHVVAYRRQRRTT